MSIASTLRSLLRRITTQQQRIRLYDTLNRCRKSLAFMKGCEQQEGSQPFVDKLNQFAQPYRLHLGCGNIKLNGFCNVDALETIAADVVDDIRTLKKFPNGSAQEIYACHVLEHFSHEEVMPLLRRWFEVLRPGGVLRISVPDIDRIVRIYQKNPAHFQTKGHSPWIGLIYGGQSTPYDYHKTGFNACWLVYLLEQCGFEQCEEYPHLPHFVPGTQDASVADAPFGEFFSLNMMSRKPLE